MPPSSRPVGPRVAPSRRARAAGFTAAHALRHRLMPLLAGLALLLASAAAQAHSPRLSCQALDAAQIRCVGGFSDGSDAKGIEIRVLSYEDKLLWSDRLDAQSSIRFERPTQDFYVRFEGGEGHTLEVDHDDIR